MRRTAIGVGASATIGSGAVGSVAADDDDDDSASDLAIKAWVATSPVGGAAAVAYGALFSNDDHEEEVENALDYQDHVSIYTRAREDELQLDQTISSLERDVQLIQNKAREEAIFRVYEQGVDGGSEADATAAAEDAINEAYAVVQKSILETWTMRFEYLDSLIGSELVPEGSESVLFTHAYSYDDEAYSSTSGVAESGTNAQNSFLSDDGGADTGTDVVTLYDGSTFEYPYTWYEDDNTATHFDPTDKPSAEFHLYDRVVVEPPDPDDYDGVDEEQQFTSRVTLLDTGDYYNLYTDLDSERDDLITEVDQIVDTYYAPAADGEIDLTNMLGPAHLTGTASEAEDFEEAALALRAMGFKLADQATEIEVEHEGEELIVDGRLARTVEDPNPLPVGEEIEPETTVGSIYAAVNVEEEDGLTGETIEITDPFTIVGTADGSGEVNFESRQLAESDHNLTAEEIGEIFEENQQANDEAREIVHETAVDVGLGLGDFGDEIPTLGIVAAGAAIVALIINN